MQTTLANCKFGLLCVLVFLYLVLSSGLCYGEVFIFDDKVIGKAIEDPVSLISVISLTNNEKLKPAKIEVFFNDLKYSAAVVYYPFNKSNFLKIANVLDNLYRGSEQKWLGSEFKYWRIDKRKFAVALSHDEPCPDKEQYILVTYRSYSYKEK